MIVGIGTDTVIINRVAKLVDRWGDRFAQRVLGPAEYDEYQRRKGRGVAGEDRAIRYIAKRFAAKEAIGKALGVGLFYPMSLHSVEILNDRRGAPQASPRKALAQYLSERNYQVHVSISDEIEHAQALAIVETVAA
ncbi:MAG: holo-[acyl-carrier-protein] synthase [Burkholderiaceae bacterium]|nr:holo-[acyl-carrier-protein] synthase [Burkholderiaceae bacterium]